MGQRRNTAPRDTQAIYAERELEEKKDAAGAREMARDGGPAQWSSRGAELPRGDWSMRGGDAWVPGRRLAKRAARHRPLLPGQPRKPAGVGEGWGGIAATAAPALRETAGREGGSWGDNPPPPFLPQWAQPPTLTSPPSAGARTPPNPVAPLAPTPRPRQRHSHPPPPLPQPGWGGGQPPGPPTPLRWGRERDGRKREEGAERDLEEGMGERLGLGGGLGRGLLGKGEGP